MPKKRQPLSRERILDAALQLVDADGLEQLSMRRLGAALGVEAMSLYKHVPNKAALLDGIHDRLVREIGPVEGVGWRGLLAATARALRATLLRHPRALPLFATRPVRGESAMETLDQLFRRMKDAGFPPARRIWAVDVVGAYVIGHAFAQAGPQPEASADSEAESAAADAQALRNFAAKFPALADAMQGATPHDYDAEFEFGLEALLEGIQAARRNAMPDVSSGNRRRRSRSAPDR